MPGFVLPVLAIDFGLQQFQGETPFRSSLAEAFDKLCSTEIFEKRAMGKSKIIGTYQESCPLGVLELSTFLKLTSI
jgi:hypothetical protein